MKKKVDKLFFIHSLKCMHWRLNKISTVCLFIFSFLYFLYIFVIHSLICCQAFRHVYLFKKQTWKIPNKYRYCHFNKIRIGTNIKRYGGSGEREHKEKKNHMNQMMIRPECLQYTSHIDMIMCDYVLLSIHLQSFFKDLPQLNHHAEN